MVPLFTLRKFAVALGLLALLEGLGMPALAQLLDQLKNAPGLGQSGSGGVLGGGAVPSVNQASPSNIAGLLQFCVRNNYLSGGAASSVKDSLVSKVTGSSRGAADSEFKAGNAGMLESGDGQSLSLGGGGIKAQVTKQVCDQVLQHAKSLL